MDQRLKNDFIKTLISAKKMLMLITANLDVPFAEVAILMHIRHLRDSDDANDGVCVTEIKDQTHVSLPAVSRQLSSLEQKGYIRRMAMAKDRRITLVTLTPAGEEITGKIVAQSDLFMEKLGLRVGEDFIRKYIEMSAEIMDCLGQEEPPTR